MITRPTTVLAGVTASNATLFHRIRLVMGDAAVAIDFADGTSVVIVRELEVERARQAVRADRICRAADFAPAGGLSGDRETAIAQAAAECLRQAGETSVTVDRTLPYLYAHFIRQAGMEIEYAADLGVRARRMKDRREIGHLRHAQQTTGEAVEFACRMIAHAKPDGNGILHHAGTVLTSERVRAMITGFLHERNFSNAQDSIVVTIPHVAICHHAGTGPLRANLPVIVDIFPMDNATRYHGDMTRTVVCGEPSAELRKMYAVVREAKAAACAALKPGVTGESVHLAAAAVIEGHGYAMVRGDARHALDVASMRHGTGHGIGLEVHEPILLDHGGGEILEGEVFTVEPGLYGATHGGIRIEDMVVVTASGHEVLSPVPEGLAWND